MGWLRRLEQGLERVIDGLSARTFRGRLTPQMVVRAVEQALAPATSADGTATTANTYRITLHPDDYAGLAQGMGVVTLEAGQRLRKQAELRRLPRPLGLLVECHQDERVVPGQVQVAVSWQPREAAAELVAERGGVRVPLGTRAIIVGRGSDCELTIPSDEVSRQHASIALSGGQYVVTDLASSNGTTVNGVRVVSAPLRDGDRVGFGPAVFRFQVT